VGTEEQQLEGVVRGVAVRTGPRRPVALPRRHRVLPAAAGVLGALEVGEPAPGHRDQPADGLVGDAVARPGGRGGEQRLLHRVLAERELPVTADQHAEDLRRARPQQILERAVAGHGVSDPPSPKPAVKITGRTSTGSRSVPGIIAASSWARSGPSQSTT
jgi:hypothetical protein